MVDEYGLFPGLNGSGVDHTFEPGVNIIVGINGIGKTTMLNMIYRLLVGPWDAAKADDGVQLTRARLTKDKSFDYFAKRDRTPTKGTATGEFAFGEQRLTVTRRLTDLSLIALSIDDQPVRPGPNIDVEDEIRRLSGCGRQYDFHLLVTSLLFFLEEKTPVVWEPEAQIEMFRILFLDTHAAPALSRLGTEIQQEDSRRRNMLTQLNSYKKRQMRALAASSSAEKEVKTEANELDRRADAIDRQLQELASASDKVEMTRNANRQKLEAFRLDLEEASRALEYLHHQYFASLFPSLTDTARNVLLDLVGGTGCSVCGNRAPELALRFQEIAARGECPICGSPEQGHERFVKTASFGAGGINRQNDKVTRLKEDVADLEALTAVDDEAYRNSLRRRLDLQAERDTLVDKAKQLRLLLPASEETKVEVENYIKVTEQEIAELERSVASKTIEYKERLQVLRREVEGARNNLTKSFAEYAGHFLAEDCSLIYKPRKIRLGESTEAIEFPIFAVQMTSAVSPTSGVTRFTDADVSESQKEFIDLAFRMALLRTYAETQQTSSAMIVVETPEASLDSVFVENAGAMLRNWCRPTLLGTNSIIASCNLNRENMIAALLGSKTTEEKLPPDDINRRILNLLDVAAANAALSKHREEYVAQLQNSTAQDG
jgi:rubrerythrin